MGVFRPGSPSDPRPAWRDLSERYRWLYGMTLQERLDDLRIRADVNRWWLIGGRRDPTPTHFG